jgi:phosphoribosylformylglycinamidine cyclo-ligase
MSRRKWLRFIAEERPVTPEQRHSLTYRNAGVDLDARRATVERYKAAVAIAGRPEVLGGVGPFAGLFALGAKYRDPVLVASTDSVGTKVKIAALAGRYEGLGHDIVAHCVNDAFTTGAEPLFFLDYIASADLTPDQKVALVRGVAEACAEVGCALLGGETADMPGVYAAGDLDLVGFVVGVVERDAVIDGSRSEAGDVLFGLASNGLHTNGYSLARPALGIGLDAANAARDRARLEEIVSELGESLADALLRPHRCYYNHLRPALRLVRGMAHITGGGLEENVPRVLPAGLGARFRRGSWPTPPIFGHIQRKGGIDDSEMYRVFNMGLGMVVAVSPAEADRFQALVPEALTVGEVVRGAGVELV